MQTNTTSTLQFPGQWRNYYYFISVSFDLAVFFEFWQSCETKNIYTLVNHLSYPLQTLNIVEIYAS